MVTRRDIADQVVGACHDLGTTHAFGMPGGGSNLDVAGACAHYGLDFVLVHAEGPAAVMAAVMGELTGAPGIAVATRGPGAANALNGVAQAFVDRQPLVMITDCVAANDASRVSHQRVDQQQVFAPFTLASLALNGRDPNVAASAVALTRGGGHTPPGPVHVDLDPSATTVADLPSATNSAPADLEPVLTLVRESRRAVIVVGAGAAVAQPQERDELVAALGDLGERTNTPVLCTYKARGFVADQATYTAGVSTGATIEAPVLHDADLIIGIGLDPVEFIPAPWPYAAPVVCISSWSVREGHARSTFIGTTMTEAIAPLAASVRALAAVLDTDWAAGAGQEYRQAALARIRSAVIDAAPDGLTPQQVVDIASAAAPRGSIATVDAGAHMLVAMPLWEVDQPEQALISSGWATMGFALPAAIAAGLARPNTPVVCFTGDGGLGMVLSELETLARLALPVVVVVFNDATLSLIAAKQNSDGHGGERVVTFQRTDFAAIARASGLAGVTVNDVATYDAAIRAALMSRQPTLLDVRVDPRSYPLILDAIRG